MHFLQELERVAHSCGEAEKLSRDFLRSSVAEGENLEFRET